MAHISDDFVGLVRSLTDRAEIEDCLDRYARGLDRRQPDLLRSAFHPDATDHHGAGIEYHPAAEALLADWRSRDRERIFSQHLIINTRIDLDGDTAHAESYFQLVFGTRDDERELDHIRIVGGRYIDRFERRDGRWGIARRVVVTEFSAGLDGDPLPGLLRWSRRDATDPAFARPLLGPPEEPQAAR